MSRSFVLILLLLASTAASAAAATTVVINGKTVTVKAIEANGKAYVDIVTLMKLLGGNAAYNAATHKVIITSTRQAPSAGGAPGTAQLAGDNGELGKVYTLRKNNPLYFALQKAVFTTTPVNIGDTLYAPKASEKLLVLHFTVQNPQKTEVLARHDSLKFTVVDANDVNHECLALWGDDDSHNRVAINLKPAQKIAVYTVIVIPAKGTVPKLMVMPYQENNGPILRYDLRGKITGLTAPIADLTDPTGSTAQETVPAKTGISYPYRQFAVTVEKFDYTTDALDEAKPDAGERFLVATLLVKNIAPYNALLRYDRITPTVIDADGARLRYRAMLLATANRRIGQEIVPNQEMRVRIYFTVPKDSNPRKLALQEADSRTYEFDIP